MNENTDPEVNPLDRYRDAIVKWAAVTVIVILTVGAWAAKNGWF